MAHQQPGVRGPGAAHEQRRGEILEAVFTIVDTEGTDQVSIRRVADVAGVSIGRVQHYFPTKDDLLAGAFTAINDLGAARVHERLSDENTASDPARVLNVVLGQLIPRTDDERRFARVAQAFEAYAQTRPQLKDRLTRGYDELASLLAHLLHASVRPHADDGADGADQALRAFRARAYELLALTTGLAGLVITGSLGARQADGIASARLGEILGTRPVDRP